MQRSLRQIYESKILARPVATLVVVAALTLTVGWFAPRFALDASADSLILEQDEDLRYYRSIRARYGSDDFLIVTYTPHRPLFDEATLADLGALRHSLSALPNVAAVTSILDVPLLQSPPVAPDRLATDLRYLRDADTDPELARQELTSSPLYSDLLISNDSTTTAIRVDLVEDEQYVRLRDRRDELREQQMSSALPAGESRELAELEAEIVALGQAQIGRLDGDVAAIRSIMDRHRGAATLYLGGVPMIVADSIDFIRHDLVVFGSAVLLFLVVILASAFRKRRWIVLPLLTCAATSVFMLGFLGFLGWRVTVVSSNFLSLLLILCLALTLHIIVRYRETHVETPTADQFTLVSETVRRIVKPCFYTALTSIVAFGSLLVSGIRPVIDFGWMMSIGIVVAFLYSFTLFPAALMLLAPGEPRSRNDLTARVTRFFASSVQQRPGATLLAFLLLALVGFTGALQLTVENRFLDYYRQTTEIYQGMELIDRKLGGTTPLDVIVDAPPATPAPGNGNDDYDDEFEDIYADEEADEAGITSRSYWFNRWQIPTVARIHDYLDNLPETGKVVSLTSVTRLLEQVDPEILEDNFELSIAYGRLEPDIRDKLFDPHLSADGDQLRFGIRVFESDPSLRRAELLEKISHDLTGRLGLVDGQLRLTGMLVLYNNMLESLYQSQILTLGVVFLAILAMFLVLFRSIRIALTAIVPNLLSPLLVLGLMGWFGIPLDLMTITIAAITVGIGVDDTIHYVHRFRHEFSIDGNYWAAVGRSHRSIGRAIYYTSLTIMLGFSILALSQFVPTIYFGILTSLAMLFALLADMTLLPVLIVRFQAAGAPHEVRRSDNALGKTT